eukprot:11637667-Ditylum_brightwellii.AAC.1
MANNEGQESMSDKQVLFGWSPGATIHFDNNQDEDDQEEIINQIQENGNGIEYNGGDDKFYHDKYNHVGIKDDEDYNIDIDDNDKNNNNRVNEDNISIDGSNHHSSKDNDANIYVDDNNVNVINEDNEIDYDNSRENITELFDTASLEPNEGAHICRSTQTTAGQTQQHIQMSFDGKSYSNHQIFTMKQHALDCVIK